MYLKTTSAEIEILKAYRDKLSNSASNQLDKDIKAFDAAIKTLEQLPDIKEAYNRGYKDGQEALAFHLELCKEEAEPCDDAISRADARHLIAETNRNSLGYISTKVFKILYDGIDKLPPVTPQVICPSHGIDCEDCPAYEPKTDVLDKIRAEIIEEKNFAYADFEQYKIDYLGVDAEYVEDELPQDDFRYGMERAIEIIDKYIAESEVSDADSNQYR